MASARISKVWFRRRAEVDDTSPIIVAIKDDILGTVTTAIVLKILKTGVALLQFYNNVKAFLPEIECKKRKKIESGDTVKVRVKKVFPAEGKFHLELAEPSENLARIAEDAKPAAPFPTKKPAPVLERIIIKRYGIYTCRVEGMYISDEKRNDKLSVKIRMPSDGFGRMHVSELPERFLVEGRKPLEDFLKEFQHREVSMITMNSHEETIKEHARIIWNVSMRDRKINSVKKCKGTVDRIIHYRKGDLIPVFYASAGTKKQLVYEVNGVTRGLVDIDPDESSVLPDYGEMRTAKVMGVSKDHASITLHTIKNVELQPGSVCTARVIVTKRDSRLIKTRLMLSNGVEAFLTCTGICDDYAWAEKNASEKIRMHAMVDVRLVALVNKRWFVVMADRAKKRNPVDPLIMSRDNLKEGTIVRGFCVKEKNPVRIEIAPNIKVNATGGRQVVKGEVVSVRVVDKEQEVLHGELMPADPKLAHTRIGRAKKAKKEEEESEEDESGEDREEETAKVERTEKKQRAKKQDNKPIEQRERVQLQDPGFDWEPETFSVDALAEISRLAENEGNEKKAKKRSNGEAKDVKAEADEPNKKKKKDMTEAEREVEKERALEKKEMRILAGDALLETDDDFNRALKGDPNSASLWIRYMTHFMQRDELKNARAIAEKALKNISYREDEELLSMWCAFINLEVAYGNEESAAAVFKRGCEAADSYKIHKHMTAALAANGRLQEADELYEKMVKKFRSNTDEIWTLYGEYLMANGRLDEARALMKRALECIPKERHVDVISRFAQLEYAKGDAEKGGNLFENLLAVYPKRTDVWTVYVELNIKAAGIEQARQLLSRVTSLRLNVYKLRPFFKKWIDLERMHGDERSLAEVKAKAQQYLTSVSDNID